MLVSAEIQGALSELAVAMESKGFDGSRNRTFYREVRIGAADAVFAGLLRRSMG
ncbi:hypothetical protein [Effusibacillus pohliae]|uniref:hypothetical protein n=1 Tax=Effusibacillus pohliae TaxID=232270 RepID=UPI00037D1318|nr:hypothetical protein [Effusibacillus pohliae]